MSLERGLSFLICGARGLHSGAGEMQGVRGLTGSSLG